MQEESSVSINNTPNPYNNYNTGLPGGTPASEASQIDVTRELSGTNDTGVLGELLTEGTQHLADVNKFFAMQKFLVSGLLAENNQAVGSQAVISAPSGQIPNYVLGADDMYVAGDPGVGGKGNNYQYLPINVQPGYYTMLATGNDNGQKLTVNGHVDTINPDGNKAFTEYGFVVQDPQGLKTQATLSGGQLTIVDANGQSRKLVPPDSYTVGNPNDPTAKFYYADVPGAGKDGQPEKRLMVDYFEKPTQAVIDNLEAQGANPLEVANLRSKTTLSYGFRIPDGTNTFASPEGVGAGNPLKTTTNGVKTYYDSHYAEDEHHTLTLPPAPPYPPPYPPPPPEPPPVAANEHAKIWGDPHILDADGGKYDFQQTGIYNVLNDKGINLNAKIVAGSGKATLISDAGLVVGNRTVDMKANGTVTIGYTDPAHKSSKITLADGQAVSLDNNSTISRMGDQLTINTGEYKMQVDLNRTYQGVQYLNMDVWSKAGGVFSDGKMPSGLLGETFDAGAETQTGIRNNSAAYARSDLFSLNSTAPTTTPTTPPTSNEFQTLINNLLQQLLALLAAWKK